MVYGFGCKEAFYALQAQNASLPNERSAYVKVYKIKAFPLNGREGFFNM